MQRLLSVNDAAHYCGISVKLFRKLVRAGKLPGPSLTKRTYDLTAIDRALDHYSGLQFAELNGNDNWQIAMSKVRPHEVRVKARKPRKAPS